MRYGSVCSGIEAASAAWHPLGWGPQWFSEIEAFPSAVLKHHYPEVHNYGDFTKIPGNAAAIDVLVGGTPCQSFSIAGLRGGLDDDRGNLALEFCRLADRLRPRWVVWENVPGVLSSHGGRDFGSIVGALGELGYGTAYRILNAEFFGVPQRRRRVFLIGYSGDWRRAAAVLFERQSLSGYPPPRRETRQDATYDTAPGLRGSGPGTARVGDTRGQDCVIPVLGTFQNTGQGWWNDEPVAQSLRDASAGGASHANLVASTGETSHCLNAGAMGRIDYESETLVTFQSSQSGVREVQAHATLDANNGSRRHNGIIQGSAVRRLTPLECERLMGFSDGYTAVPYRGKIAADGPRYKALGNSMAVPCMKWLGERIQIVNSSEFYGIAPA